MKKINVDILSFTFVLGTQMFTMIVTEIFFRFSSWRFIWNQQYISHLMSSMHVLDCIAVII